MKRVFQSVTGMLLVLLLLLPGVARRSASADGESRDVSAKCTYESSRKSKYLRDRLANLDEKEAHALDAGDWVLIRWSDAPVDFVYFCFSDTVGIEPPPYRIALLDQNGGVIGEREGERYWSSGVAIEEGVYGVRLTVSGKIKLRTLMAFSGGAPSEYHPWQPTPDKLDFLLIAMHPDDDTLFLGNLMPTYGAERGLTGSILYLATRTPVRRIEALNGAWIMGLRTYPLMAGLPDIPIKYREERKREFLVEDVERTLVRYLRRLRPEVVFTHDDNGEYGHWQHIVTAAAARLAVVDAADPSYDPESANAYGVWQVKKLYLHLAAENPIFISATVPLDAFGGRTGWEIAQEAYQCHQSQRLWNHLCDNENENSLERFGLVFSAVGPDSGINDAFEHVTTGPAPTETPTPEPTEAPTEAPTPEPTEVSTEPPTAAPTQTPAPEPVAAPTAGSEKTEETKRSPVLLFATACMLLAAAGGACAALLIRRRRG